MKPNMKIMDGGGNITAFVYDKTDPADYSSCAVEIMKHDKRIEQVAFVVSTTSAIPRIEMMGGEFCGNAGRCFAYLLAQEKNLVKCTLRLSCSGAKRPVFAQVDISESTSFLEINSKAFKIKTDSFMGIALEGITHYITQEPVNAERASEILHSLAEKTQSEAVGLMVRNDNCIVPYVYVKKTDSFVAEGSCGSGAVAMAFADSEQTRKPYKTAYSFPRGTLEVSIKRTLSNAFEAKMGGEVKELKIM